MGSQAEKVEDIIGKIVELANQDKSITFTEDWGGNTLTVQVDDAHTHVGAPECSLDNLIKDLHALLVEGKGLNWVGQEDETEKLGNYPIWRERALKAEAELRRCYKDMEELTAERNDLKAMLADAGIRNAVLEKRVDKLIDVLYIDHEQLPEGYCETPPGVDCELAYECRKCWREWLEQEVQP